MAKRQYSKEDLINLRSRAARFKEDVGLFAVELQDNKEGLDAAMHFIAALQDVINWANMKLGEQVAG